MFPPVSPTAQALDRWADKVAEESGGSVTIRHYAANTLVAGPEMRDGIKAGATDIGCAFPYKEEPGAEVLYNLGRVVRGLNHDSCVKIHDDIYNEFTDIMDSQWKDYKLIWEVPIHPNILFFTNKKVTKLEDMKGQQIRCPSLAVPMMEKLGATPVEMSTSDWIISLDKGTTDGGSTSIGSVEDYHIAEKFKYAVYYCCGTGIQFLAMNLDTYNNLAPEQQKAIDNTLEWARNDIIKNWSDLEVSGIDYIESEGVEFIYLTPDEYSRFENAIRPTCDDMADYLDSKGYPGTEIVKFGLERSDFYNSK
jgi:TRAP-type C4-dicarboxylate transport system substrate-binding protein